MTSSAGGTPPSLADRLLRLIRRLLREGRAAEAFPMLDRLARVPVEAPARGVAGHPSKYAPFCALAMFSGRAKLKDFQNGRCPPIRPATPRGHLSTATT